MRKTLTLLIAVLLSVSIVSAQSEKDYYKYIKKSGKSPIEYLTDKLRSYSVVCVGEDHWINDHPAFICEFLRATYQDSLASIDALALEFGNEMDQALADSLMKSDTFREDFVYKILQHAPDTYGNPFQSYEEIFRTVWEINRQRGNDKQIRILLLDPAYVQRNFDGEAFVFTGSRDDIMFSKIRSYLLSRKHVLFYAGAAHTQAQISGTSYKEGYYNYPSAGYLLKKCYPDNVFIVNLWGAYMGSYGYEKDDHGEWVKIGDGTIDRAFDRNGNEQVAFDLAGPFNSMTAQEYYADPRKPKSWENNKETQSPYKPDILMKDRIDGIIFIGPVSEFSGQTMIDIYDGDFLKIAATRSNGELKTSQDILDYLGKIHPILQRPNY